MYASHPDIAEVAVIGLPHPRWAEAITAVVVPKPDTVLNEGAILEDLKGSIAGFKTPKR